MKKTVLFFAVAFIAIGINAQKVWNLGGDPVLATTSPAFALTTGIGIGDGSAGNPAYPVMIDGLGITGIATNFNMGAVNASVKTFGNYNFANRFQLNGAGYTGAVNTDINPGTYNMPTQRYLTFNVSGNSTIYAIGVTGSNSSSRSLFVTNGTTFIGKMDFPAGTGLLNDATVTYTGPATTIYIFGNSSINLCLLSATNYVASNTNEVFSNSSIVVRNNEIVNVNKSNIEVYTVLGKKILSSSENISLKNFQKGIYFVRIAGTNEALKFSI
jgi:hypothetical protein